MLFNGLPSILQKQRTLLCRLYQKPLFGQSSEQFLHRLLCIVRVTQCHYSYKGRPCQIPSPLVLLTYAHLTNASTVILLSLLALQFLPPRPKGNVILVFTLACIALFELMLMFVGRQSQLTLPRPNYLLLTFPISTLICAALLPSLICGLFCPTSALSAARPRPGKQHHHHFNHFLGS